MHALVGAASAATYKEGRVVLGYFPVQRTVSDIPWQSLTHANIAFAHTSDSGDITFVGDVVNSTMSSEENARELIAAGQKNDVKMLVAVGGQGTFSEHLATALSSPESQSAFLSNAVNFVKDYNLDGIDIDWEYPKNVDDAQTLLSALQGTRDALDKSFGKGKKLLTITLYNHPYLGPDVPTVDYKPYYEAVDYGLMMAYDYFGSWADYTAPNSPFVDVPFYPGSFRNTTDAWLAAGWPANKLVAGLAFYGHSSIVSTEMSANMTNQYVPIDNHTSIDGPISEISGTWTWRDLREPSDGALSDPSTAGSGWARTWDRFTMTPWLFRKSDGVYVGYDDQDSLGIKLDYSLRNDLAGVMIWEIGYDYKNELMSYVRDFIVQIDDGAEPKNCAPSNSELDNIYDTSRNPAFFNRRSPGISNIRRDALDTDAPICHFGDADEHSAAVTTWRLSELKLTSIATAVVVILVATM
ncbi:glycoside hydrolase [Coemansia reversa NRRL 1564]|uniref:Glycoside hydrolase n=1 Tax=Coemansia reversa (strain ATCC 12441 / NRRL 1564) TaxID=763665 RepID=A0A2G5BED2_COERN|nr:glycoside hydrolase [Coemansia reversa NRRL 1564]|eukprot:PIA17378.1 glycoside hydrolase [Coemansia reversa NRRL 1564]